MIDNITKDERKVLLQKTIMKLMNDPRVNSWEKEFLSSIHEKILTTDLTEKQTNVLNRIRRKCTDK